MSLKYLTPYNKNRVGLHTYIDSVDENQYLYTQFEAFHCHRVFPCFDQPSLKAKMTLTCTAPSDWHVVSNGQETRHEDAREQGKKIVEKFSCEWFLDFYKED